MLKTGKGNIYSHFEFTLHPQSFAEKVPKLTVQSV